jgi:hypothetical protein
LAARISAGEREHDVTREGDRLSDRREPNELISKAVFDREVNEQITCRKLALPGPALLQSEAGPTSQVDHGAQKNPTC